MTLLPATDGTKDAKEMIKPFHQAILGREREASFRGTEPRPQLPYNDAAHHMAKNNIKQFLHTYLVPGCMKGKFKTL